MLRRALWATATTKSSPGTVIDLFKAEMTHSKRVWESTAAVELVTMGVSWWNTTQLYEALGYHAPAEVEGTYHQEQGVAPVAS